ncbi:MAG: hypothetical protein KQH83_02480 [Actinobacteria bacterium]|nr:hypothetical protein [Actinomycetota bacterium]
MDLIKQGSRALFGGARKGNTALTGLGAVLLAMGWVRRRYRSDRELLYARTLRKGDAVRIRLLGADDSPGDGITIEG